MLRVFGVHAQTLWLDIYTCVVARTHTCVDVSQQIQTHIVERKEKQTHINDRLTQTTHTAQAPHISSQIVVVFLMVQDVDRILVKSLSGF